jgi:hypothetical protein
VREHHARVTAFDAERAEHATRLHEVQRLKALLAG